MLKSLLVCFVGAFVCLSVLGRIDAMVREPAGLRPSLRAVLLAFNAGFGEEVFFRLLLPSTGSEPTGAPAGSI
ncbi:MAG TPA: hypothetical protein VGI95_10320 [Caulobacteraceae bacterium]